jgi:GR25 family glycosyltransferase involved in LPS biosynthesis
MTLNDYFDQIFCINLARRTDRMQAANEQAAEFGFTFTRFEAHDMPGWGNNGCTASHRGVLELICHHGWKRTLILEDDFLIVYKDFNERFAAMIGEVPEDWRMLYLGGHYAENPRERVSEHVIRHGHMKTTSSYAVTLEQAREMAPHTFGVGPIDELYRVWHETKPCYILSPRLMAQFEGYSDLECLDVDHSMCMLNTTHENTV